ncbi:MAG: zinc ABC transporter substrate-binding protein [Methanothrix sp.]|jgi:zinc/manganese transport system substrate-binding protein|nr:zinc ABC transporter substrate-binding protein [Methanothrix sp.]OPX82231.1 MAG: Periplasmic solute binding protein family protein [Methanosaeta sp. PtaB.Bin087]NLX40016.1 zinc ABC transporter substrate-binding protein [Methanothrix sp.]HNR58254.1 zinc ABC transporter substrate-binding protein [Methanothrix sp.]HNT72707.1 zinc ABC transporter substrate-binding protein [Methanothrix sp.]
MDTKRFYTLIILALAIFSIAPSFADQAPERIKIVCTTSVLMDPATFIGGDKVEAISIADPTLCPHLQADIIPNRIQLNMDFIKKADVFMAYNDNNDKNINMPAVENFMEANGFGSVEWRTVSDPSRGWNTPTTAKLLASEVFGWLVEEDPANEGYYQERYDEYVESFDAVEPTDAEREQLNQTKVIVMLWQREPVEKWLGMEVVNFFAPEFVMNGTKTAEKVVDDIILDPEKYADVEYVIENMQSGELGKGIEEALLDRGINAERVIFTNFPRSILGVDTIPQVLSYNKQLVL